MIQQQSILRLHATSLTILLPRSTRVKTMAKHGSPSKMESRKGHTQK